eukprot:3449805-Pleurochrysis_carterae.AAC.1
MHARTRTHAHARTNVHTHTHACARAPCIRPHALCTPPALDETPLALAHVGSYTESPHEDPRRQLRGARLPREA